MDYSWTLDDVKIKIVGGKKRGTVQGVTCAHCGADLRYKMPDREDALPTDVEIQPAHDCPKLEPQE